MSGHNPPRWLEYVLERAVPGGLSGQGTLGDLAEEFERRALESPLRARLWYAGQALSILLYGAADGRNSERSTNDSNLGMDLRWSMRSIFRHPGFSFGVVAVLGLGLGANAAVFSVVDGTLGNTSWWDDPDATVAIWPDRQFSFGQIELYAEETDAYRAMGGYVELAFALQTPDGESESINGAFITPGLFRELAVQPSLGRALIDDDAYIGVERVVVIGDALWRRTFAGDPAIIGTRIDVGGGPATVVGIQGPGGLAPGGRAEFWFPLLMDPREDEYWKAQSHAMIGVLKEGGTLAEAQADLMGFTASLTSLFPLWYPVGWADGIATVARADEAQRRMIRTPLLLLLAGTGLLMLVTALNVGNLLLGRAIGRRKELAVRASLGAGRGSIVAQLLVEGLVLTVLALEVGLGTAALGGEWIERLFVEEAVVSSSSVLSPAVLLFALVVSVLAWVVLNCVPVIHFLRTQRSGLNVAPDSGAGVQRSLVTIQAALATLLLVSATLFVATVGNLRQVPLGFDANGLLTVELSPPEDRVATVPDAWQLYDRLVENVGALPGVEAVGLTAWLPLRAQAPPAPINLRAAPVHQRESVKAPMHHVDAGFFEALEIDPSAGRLLGSEDRAMVPSAIVVNETLAQTLWPDGSAVGQMIATDPHAWDTWATVVGVIPDIRSGDITGAVGPALYVALAESPTRDITLVIRTQGSEAGLIPMVTRTVRETDAVVSVRSVTPMADVVRAAYATSWVMMGLLVVLAVLATALGAIGIYAVLAHHVTLNKREIGVRMALGAQPGVVVGAVVRSGLALAGLGIVIGSLAAAASTRFLESLLFDVSALAPWAFVAPAIALGAAATLAAWVPAARAGRLPPAEVLRSD
jgi:putative ABC transport system permease protein